MIRLLFAALIALATLTACDMREPDRIPETQNPITLNAYTVPPERAEMLQDALNQVLGKKGSASRGASDKLLVLAPAILQSSVKVTLESLVKDAPKAMPDPGPVRLQAWVVDVAENAETDSRLLPVAPTLDAVKESLGAPGFVLYAQLAIRASFGPSYGPSRRAGDDRASLEAKLSPAESGVFAELQMAVGTMHIETQTQLKFGETIVLAQASPTEDGRSRVRLILVRADPAA